MLCLILVLILLAAYNATRSVRGKPLRWSVAAYWVMVACYWTIKCLEVEK